MGEIGSGLVRCAEGGSVEEIGDGVVTEWVWVWAWAWAWVWAWVWVWVSAWAWAWVCTQEGRKVRREKGPYRFPKAGRYTPAAAEIFSPLVLLFPYRACFFGIRFSLPITTLWERGRKRVGGCCGSERSELKFEIVQKNCTTTNLPVRYRMEKTRFYGFGR